MIKQFGIRFTLLGTYRSRAIGFGQYNACVSFHVFTVLKSALYEINASMMEKNLHMHVHFRFQIMFSFNFIEAIDL